MKLLIVIIFFIISCSDNPKNWEYKVERFVNNGYQRTGEEAAKPSVINITEARLNELGGEGWELVSTSMEMETARKMKEFGVTLEKITLITGLSVDQLRESGVL